VQQRVVWLSGWLPFEQVSRLLDWIGGLSIPKSSVYDQMAKQGERLEQYRLWQQAHVSYERVVLDEQSSDPQNVKSVSLDGGMVHIRDEGWKEFKVGSVSAIGRQDAASSGQPLANVALSDTAYTAVLGEVNAFAPALWALAVQQGVPTAYRSNVTADGAAWIWNLVEDYFPDSVQIVDWYHADHHLAEAAQALFPQDEGTATRWRKQMQTPLYLGDITAIVTPLEQAQLQEHAHYFHTHHRRMQYLEFREQGFPIGSGGVESGIKQFKARLSGAGMHWSRAGAQRMLTLRAAVLSHHFDDLWQAA
jgi:hypothetical protein